MSTNASSIRLLWDLAAVGSVDDSQRWILTAMKMHGQVLTTMLWRILGNEADVCDAYQQTFLQLAHYQDRGRTKPDNVRGFLFRTAANTAISTLRYRKKKEQAIHRMGSERTERHDGDPVGDLDAKDMQDRLREAVSRLPEYLREVVLLHDLAELSYREVSEVAGISVATARVYRCKAVTLLAAMMAGE